MNETSYETQDDENLAISNVVETAVDKNRTTEHHCTARKGLDSSISRNKNRSNCTREADVGESIDRKYSTVIERTETSLHDLAWEERGEDGVAHIHGAACIEDEKKHFDHDFISFNTL